MKSGSVNMAELSAKTSRTLGILSLVFLFLAFLIGAWIRFSDFDEIRKLALVAWVGYAYLGNLLSGLPACITAIIALRKNKAEGDDPGVKRIAITGLVLGSLGVIVILVIFISAWLFGTSSPMPGPAPLPRP